METKADEPGSRRNYLEDGGKTLALLAVLLPAAGFVVRYVSFWTAGVEGSPSSLALSASIAQLAVTAVWTLVGPALVVLLGWVVFLRPGSAVRSRAGRKGEKEGSKDTSETHDDSARNQQDDKAAARRARLVLFAYLLILAVVGFFMLFFVPGFPGPQLAFATGLGCSVWLGVAMRHPPERWFASTWPGMVVLIVVAAAAGALGGSLTSVTQGQYTFESPAVLPDGRYQLLGTESGRLFLEPCEPAERATLGVRDDSVALVRAGGPRSKPGPNLWQILFDGDALSIGLQRC